jgi:hypothetical protein
VSNSIGQVCTFPAGIRASGHKELMYALHFSFLNKLPEGYDPEDLTFLCDPENSVPVGQDWSNWSPILPLCIMQESGKQATKAWKSVLSQRGNTDNPTAAKMAAFLYIMCGDRNNGLNLGLRYTKGTIQLTERAALLITGAPAFDKLMGDSNTMPCNLAEFDQVSTHAMLV